MLKNTDKIILEVQKKQVFGKTLYYPNNEVARQFTQLLGVKTLTKGQINDIAAIGIAPQLTQEVW